MDEINSSSAEEEQAADDGAGQDLSLPSLPVSAANDALKEALDLAQSVGERDEILRNGSGLGLGNFDDSVSLNEYIDEAERRSRTIFDSPSFGDEGPIEDLDGLDIAAEFGRPDDSTESEEPDFSDISIVPPTPLLNEDTKDLKSPSMAPPKAEPENSRQPQIAARAGDSSVPPSYFGASASLSTKRSSVPPFISGAIDSRNVNRRTSSIPPISFERLKIEGKLYYRAACAEMPIWKLFIAAYAQSYSGRCIVRTEGRNLDILFEGGYIVHATVDVPDEDFAAYVAHEAGLLPRELDSIRAAIRTGKEREALAASGIRRPELNRLARSHAEKLVRSAIAATEGDWQLIRVEKRTDLPESPVETPTPAIVLRGIAESMSSDAAEQIAPKSAVLVPVESPPATLGELTLTAEERDAVASWDDTVLLGDAISRYRPNAGLHSLAAALVQLGCFEARSPDPNRLKQSAVLGPTTLEGELLRRLQDKLEKVQKGTYYEILEVSPDADREALIRARESLIAYFDEKRFSTAGTGGTESALRLVRRMIEEAFQVLEEPERRLRYRRAVTEQAMDE